MLKKRVEGGFINPAYEKWNRRAGIAAVVLIFATFIWLVSILIAGDPSLFTPEDPFGTLR